MTVALFFFTHYTALVQTLFFSLCKVQFMFTYLQIVMEICFGFVSDAVFLRSTAPVMGLSPGSTEARHRNGGIL
jgi:hypothetical protein